MLSDPRLIMFSGKGGVGKTTCASAKAVSLAAAGGQTLLFSTDPAHSLSDMFEQTIGSSPTSIKSVPHLFAMELNAEEILSEFKDLYKENIFDLLVNITYLEEEDIASLFSLSFPGLDEVMGLKKIVDFMGSEGAYAYYVWDTAPTGHTLRLLCLPELFDEWIKALALMQLRYQQVIFRIARKNISAEDDFLFSIKKMIRQIKKYLIDPQKTQFISVTIPEGLAVEETKRMSNTLQQRGITIQSLIINQVMPDNTGCPYCRSRQEIQRKYIQQLEKIFSGKKIIMIPAWPEEIKGVVNLKKIAAIFEQGRRTNENW